MSQVVIVVPKYDELHAISWAFGQDLSAPEETTPSGTRIYRRSVGGVSVSFAFMDCQNNTNSAVVAAEVLQKEQPRAVFLVGTAMGHPTKTSLGSVIISKSIEDIVERSHLGKNEVTWKNVPRGSSPDLNLRARNFAKEQFKRPQITQAFREARTLTEFGSQALNLFVKTHKPEVLYEDVASGNDYFMGEASEMANNDLWKTFTKVRAYDMESAGFARIAEVYKVPWLVIRGISDFGFDKSNDHRILAAAMAGRFLAKFLDYLLDEQWIVADSAGASSISGAPRFLYTLDDQGVVGFDEMVSMAYGVDVLSRTSVNLLSNYRATFERLMRAGGRIRLLMVDPTSDVANRVYGKDIRAFGSNMVIASNNLEHLEELDSKVPGSLEVRLLRDYPPFSMTRISGPEGTTTRVQLNFLYTRIARDRPVFDITTPPWNEAFGAEFEAIWHENEANRVNSASIRGFVENRDA